jgi:hypothetical protein
MRTNDQIAIYESYRDEILNKFKNSLSGENDVSENDSVENEGDIENGDDVEDIDMGDNEEPKPKEKKNVVVKSQEISVKLEPQLREILRRIPPVSEDTEILTYIKKAIEKYNSQTEDEDLHIKDSALKVYDKLIELNAINEEEMESDAIEDFEKSQGDEGDVLGAFEGEDYREFDDDTPEWERKWDSEAEKDKLRELIRQAGTDWRRDDEDYLSSNY